MNCIFAAGSLAVENHRRSFDTYSYVLRCHELLEVVKVTALPLQAWRGPEGSRKLRFPDFMTMTKDGGKVVNLTHRPPLLPGNTPGTHLC